MVYNRAGLLILSFSHIHLSPLPVLHLLPQQPLVNPSPGQRIMSSEVSVITPILGHEQIISLAPPILSQKPTQQHEPKQHLF